MKSSQDNKRSAFRNFKPTVLSDSLHRQLSGYALAAGAAGVAALACAPQAEAAPICKNLSIQILGNNTLPFNPAGEKFPPFQIAQTTFGTFTSAYSRESQWDRGFFTPNSLGANLLLGKSNFPANVASGASIGPSGNFGKGGSYGLLFTYGVGSPGQRRHGTLLKHQGNLNLQGTNYIGFQFSHAGRSHYGWARLQVTLQPARVGKTSVIHFLGWGYEATPNTAIAAGSCSTPQSNAGTQDASSIDSPGASLGILALGSEGLSKWRGPQF
jgi:hypothetical protein